VRAVVYFQNYLFFYVEFFYEEAENEVNKVLNTLKKISWRATTGLNPENEILGTSRRDLISLI
jgi:hypothetical protein